MSFHVAGVVRSEVLREESGRARDYRSRHEYRLEEMGLARQRLLVEHRDVIERFGFAA